MVSIPLEEPMSSQTNDLPELDQMFQAADEHAAATGEVDMAIGDLQEILRAAWRLMTSEQREALFAETEPVALAELHEYEPLIRRLVRPT